MKAIICTLLAALLSLAPLVAADKPTAKKIKTLIITGGHGFEKEPFFQMFRDNPEITFDHAVQSMTSSDAYDRPDLYEFDVIVLYDMIQNISEQQKTRFKKLFDRGTGLVVLHHALVNYQNWPEFERIIGGTYPEPQDKRGAVTDQLGYEHDVDIPVTILATDHPVTAGLKDFTLHDEIYWGYRTTSDAKPLLSTPHPKSGKPLAWTRSEGKSRVVYLQLGHGPTAFNHPSYRQLLSQTIRWTAPK